MERKKDTKVIYIGHRKRMGKSTVASMIKSNLAEKNVSAKVVSLATPIKTFTANLFGVNHDTLDREKNDTSRFTVMKRGFIKGLGDILNIPVIVLERATLLDVGTSINDTWEDNPLRSRVLNIVESGVYDVVIISDFRLRKEFFKKGTTIKVVNRNVSAVTERNDIDEELDLFDFDYVIDNNGTIADLGRSVKAVLEDVSVYKSNPVMHSTTNVVVELKDISVNHGVLESSIITLALIKHAQVTFTLVYDDDIRDKYRDLLDKAKHLLGGYKRSSYVDNLTLLNKESMYNVIYVSNTKIQGIKHLKIYGGIRREDVAELRTLIARNVKDYTV